MLWLPRSCIRIVAHAEEHRRMRRAKPAARGNLINFTLILTYFSFAFGVITKEVATPPTLMQCKVGPTHIKALKQVR